jgi:NADH-quinone oxidoreductase subunit L
MDRGILVPFLFAFYVGALAKSAQIPFHEWLVTAMTGPAPVSALIHAATMVKAGVFYALRFTPWLVTAALALGATGVVYSFIDALLWLVLVTAFALATMALVARELKLILAYSTASQLSYMFAAIFAASLYALAARELAVLSLGEFAGFSHLVSHATFKAALFLAAGALIHAVHSRYITDMGGLRHVMPYTFIATLLAGFSLAAIPLFSGWWSKDAVVLVVKKAGVQYALLALVTAVVTAAYSLRMLVYVFTEKPLGRRAHGHEPGWLMRGSYLVLGVASLLLGLAWYPLLEHWLAEGFNAKVELDPTSMLVGSIAAVGGSLLGSIYLLGFKPWRLIEATPLLRLLHGFLYDRWYINALIYRILVYPGSSLASLVQRTAEHAIDVFYHTIVPRATSALGLALRLLHGGFLPSYLAYFVIGLLVALLVNLAVGGLS